MVVVLRVCSPDILVSCTKKFIKGEMHCISPFTFLVTFVILNKYARVLSDNFEHIANTG